MIEHSNDRSPRDRRGRRRVATWVRVAALSCAVGLVVTACGDDTDEGQDPDVERTTTTVPEPEPDPAPDVARVAGVTTASEYEGEDGLERWSEVVPAVEDVRITSSIDGHEQPALWVPPSGDEPQPLLVVLHTWSFGYEQRFGIPFAQWASEQGWAMIHPEFRGVFERPEATGSDLAVQDVVDAVGFATSRADVDEERVFVVGFSGGGMMSLLMAGRHPELFAGAAAWVPIHDLVDWYGHHVEQDTERSPQYIEQISSSCGGDPVADEVARADCMHRSPSSHLDAAREAGLPVYIGHGLDDDVVPPSHAVDAFNQLVDDADAIEGDLATSISRGELPDDARGVLEADAHFDDADPEVFFVRASDTVTLVLFDGEHDMVFHPGLAWMAALAYENPTS